MSLMTAITIGTAGIVGASVTSSSGTGALDDSPIFGTSLIGTGTTASVALISQQPYVKMAVDMRATQVYMESMSQEQLCNMLAAVDSRTNELTLAADKKEAGMTLVKTL